MEPQFFSSFANITFSEVPKKISFIFKKKDGSDMTIRSDVVKLNNAKKSNFWVFFKKKLVILAIRE